MRNFAADLELGILATTELKEWLITLIGVEAASRFIAGKSGETVRISVTLK